MSANFDPSPRASKRRKTTRYGSQRTMLSDEPEDTITVQADVEITPIALEKRNGSSKKSSSRRRVNGHSASEVESTSDAGAHLKNLEGDVTPSKTARGKNARKSVQESTSKAVDIESALQNEEGQAEPQAAQYPGGTNESTNEPTEEEEEPQTTRSSGRQRKKPNRFTNGMDKVPSMKAKKGVTLQSESPQKTIASPVVKGILTPSRKQKTPRPRKSVMFDQDEAAIGEQFGFKDIDTPVKSAKTPVADKRIPRKTAVLAGQTFTDSNDVEPELPVEVDDLHIMAVDGLSDGASMPGFVTIDESPIAPIGEDSPQIQAIKSEVLSRLCSASLPSKPPSHLESQYSQLYSLLQSTIVSGESNSLLLLGPRGAGKSMLLSLALDNLSKEATSDYHTVRLNGFFQTDDRLALREIWRQLGREMQVDEIETEDVAGSYADTMASLLSLLSHPDELGVESYGNGDDVETLASNAVQIAVGGQRTSKSIVFILDEFDLFTTHPRQTLLYNLFDIAQSRKAPIAVIGCSTRMDVIDCLEKRVKSRFSHRWLLVSSCRTFLEWESCVKEALMAASRDKLLTKDDSEELKCKEEWNDHIQKSFLPSKETQKLLKHYFYTTKSLPDLYVALYPIIATLSLPATNHAITTNASTQQQNPQTHQPVVDSLPNTLTLLPHLPTLHTSLLISHSRLETIHHLPSANFNLIYTHYTELIAQSRLRQTAHGSISVSGSLRCWSRETCRAAWEDLGRWGLVVPVSGGGGGAREDADGEIEETRMWKCEITLEDMLWVFGLPAGGGIGGVVGGHNRGPGRAVLEKWCREV